MVVTERITGAVFERFVLSHPAGQWELHRGEIREKPSMSMEHNWTMFYLGHLLQSQLDVHAFQVRVNAGHVRYTERNYYIPDVCVLPIDLALSRKGHPLEVYDAALPLVAEVWSPSTGTYDVESKVPEYQARGDREIWRVQPFERTLTAWVRQPDDSYTLTVYSEGVVSPAALPGVAIDLATLFHAETGNGLP